MTPSQRTLSCPNSGLQAGVWARWGFLQRGNLPADEFATSVTVRLILFEFIGDFGRIADHHFFRGPIIAHQEGLVVGAVDSARCPGRGFGGCRPRPGSDCPTRSVVAPEVSETPPRELVPAGPAGAGISLKFI